MDEDLVERIQDKIEWEGFDDYLEGGWADEDFAGHPELVRALGAYKAARDEIIDVLREAGVDV